MRINEAVGRFLKQYRTEHGLTLDDIATASHHYGTNWTAAKIRDIERGGGSADSLPVILILLSALNDLRYTKEMPISSDEDLKIIDIFGDETHVEIADGRFVSVNLIALILAGDTRTLDGGIWHGGKHPFKSSIPVVMSSHDGKRTPEYSTAAESRAAAKLGLQPLEVTRFCINWFGHTLDEEASKRAGAGASPQKRGRATREIIQEMQDALHVTFLAHNKQGAGTVNRAESNAD